MRQQCSEVSVRWNSSQEWPSLVLPAQLRSPWTSRLTKAADVSAYWEGAQRENRRAEVSQLVKSTDRVTDLPTAL
eukprot:102673-Alexandrium_andersonii.AAC.1